MHHSAIHFGIVSEVYYEQESTERPVSAVTTKNIKRVDFFYECIVNTRSLKPFNV